MPHAARFSIAFVVLFAACGGDVIVFADGAHAGSDSIVVADAGRDSIVVADAEVDALSCAQLQSAASSEYWALFDAAVADRTCRVDSDCTQANGSCFKCCGGPYTNTTGAAALNAFTTEACQQLTDEGCAIPLQQCPCVELPIGAWSCVGGTCGGSVDAGTDTAPDTAPDSQTCTELQSAGRTAFSALVDANVSCTVDSDCTFTSGGCFDVCSESITNVTGSFVVGEAANVMCQILSSEGCAIQMGDVPCVVAPNAVACRAGNCVGVY